MNFASWIQISTARSTHKHTKGTCSFQHGDGTVSQVLPHSSVSAMLEGDRHHHRPKTAWPSLWLAPRKTKPTSICMYPCCVIHKMATVCSCVLHGAHARETHVWFDQSKVRQTVCIFLMRTSRLPCCRHLQSSEGLTPTGRKCSLIMAELREVPSFE